MINIINTDHEFVKKYKECRGFVFTSNGTYNDKSIEDVLTLLVQNEVTDSFPQYIFCIKHNAISYLFIWSDTSTFDSPRFFNVMDNFRNQVPIFNYSVNTLREFIN